jgi:hypothetical protein
MTHFSPLQSGWLDTLDNDTFIPAVGPENSNQLGDLGLWKDDEAEN